MMADSDDLPAAVKQAVLVLQTLQQRIGSVDAATQRLEGFPSLAAVTEQLDDREAAKFSISLAYALASLYFVQMNIAGKDVSNHPIQEILQRIKGYVAQVSQPAEDTDGKRKAAAAASASDGKAAKRIKVDGAAAGRVVRHHLT